MVENIDLRKAFDDFSDSKMDKNEYIPGLIGVTMGGANQVTCANRPGYVWVRLHGNPKEFVQAYNSEVVPVFDFPVLVVRNPLNKNHYYIMSDKESHEGILTANATYLEYWNDDGVRAWTGNPSSGQTLKKSGANLVWTSRSHPIWFTNEATHVNWDGDATAQGSTTFAANDFNANISSAANALLIALASKWDLAGDGYYCLVKPTSGTGNFLIVRALVANIGIEAMGVVPLNASHQFTITVGGRDTTYTKVSVLGYWYQE